MKVNTLRLVLILLVAWPFSAVSQALSVWPTTGLADYVDYRHSSLYAGYEEESPVFRDVPYPNGVLFSTTAGSLYWFDDDKDTVTCLLPLNGQVEGLSMTADRSLYSFSVNGVPYFWRPGKLPGVVLEEVPWAAQGQSASFRLNATGTMAILSTYYADEYESYYTFGLVDLKTLTEVRKFETGWSRPEFTPDGKGVVIRGQDYDENGYNPTQYIEAQTFQGSSIKRISSSASNEDKGSGRYRAPYDDDSLDWNRIRTDRVVPESPNSLDSWAALGLPDVAAYENAAAHNAVIEDGFYVTDNDEAYPRNVIIARVQDSQTVWRHRYVKYGVYENYRGAQAWLDTKARRLLVLLARADGGSDRENNPTYRMVLRTLDWATGEQVGKDVALGGSEIGALTDWVPDDFAAVSTRGGSRLEYSFKTGGTTVGNGKVAFRGRPVSSVYPSTTGSVTYDMAGKSYTMARFPGQVGAIVDVAIRDDLKLVAALDEGGQLVVRRLADGEVVFQSTFSGGQLVNPPVEFTADDLKPVFALPAASKAYRTQAFQYVPKK